MEKVSVPVLHVKARRSSGSRVLPPRPSNEDNETDEYLSANILSNLDVPSVESLESMHLVVPPTTPAASFSFSNQVEPLQHPFPSFSEAKIPYIREVGVKATIDILSQHFSCSDYKFNLIQFWFLDVIADCLWKMQDEFQFPERYQKIIVEWILYVLELIRDPRRNLSRKEFFQIFNEALDVADEQVQSGCEMVPLPKDLFKFAETEEKEISFPSGTTQDSTISEVDSGQSYIGCSIDESIEVFRMPKLPGKCYQYDVATSSSTTETAQENKSTKEDVPLEEEVEFYKPDFSLPERFYSSSSSSTESVTPESEALPPLTDQRFLWKESSFSSKLQNRCSNEPLPRAHPSPQTSAETVEHEDNIKNEWENYLFDRSELLEHLEKNIMINSCVLFAIRQFVYDYFYESFQFKIVKLALINNFTTITQTINTEWKIPKVLKEELKKPKIKKEKKKKHKKKKPKKPRKKTKAKHKKKKKDKHKKKSKKGKKDKKSKKHKLTKEEKAELARLKREQERLEEEMRREQENRRLLFPLKEATDDDFFRSIFEHWVKPKEKKSKGKKKKGKLNKKRHL